LSLKKWWEDPLYNDQRSRFVTKKERLIQLAAFTNHLLNQKDILNENSKKITTEPERFSGYCLTSALNYLQFSQKNNKELEWLSSNYLTEAEKCWATLNDIQNGVMCMACDPNANNAMNLEKGTVFIGLKTVDKVNEDCKVLLWYMSEKVIPYMKKVSDLTRCDMSLAKESNTIEVFSYNGLIVDMSFYKKEDAKIDESNVTEIMSFGSRVNQNIEGQISYLLKVENNLNHFLPHPKFQVIKNTENQIMNESVKQIKKTERLLTKKDWLFEDDEKDIKMLAFSPLSDPSANLSKPPIAKKQLRRLSGNAKADTKKLKDKNYDIDFSKCRGNVTEDEKKNGTIQKGDGRDETMKERMCMVLRQMVVDWKNSEADFDEFSLQWKLGMIKTGM